MEIDGKPFLPLRVLMEWEVEDKMTLSIVKDCFLNRFIKKIEEEIKKGEKSKKELFDFIKINRKLLKKLESREVEDVMRYLYSKLL